MDALVSPNPDLSKLKSDMDELRRDVSTLLSHLKSGATHTMDHLGQDTQDEAKKLYGQVTVQSKKTLSAIGHQIDEHPTLSAALIMGSIFLMFKVFSR